MNSLFWMNRVVLPVVLFLLRKVNCIEFVLCLYHLFHDRSGVGPILRSELVSGSSYSFFISKAVINQAVWLPSHQLGMIVDRGPDFPLEIERTLLEYGSEMWVFRYQPDHRTTRALNSFRGEHRRWEILSTCLHCWDSVVSFEYKTPRIRLTPADLEGTKLAKAKMLHFVCSPSRALSIISEFNVTWEPITIYEPIPVRCQY